MDHCTFINRDAEHTSLDKCTNDTIYTDRCVFVRSEQITTYRCFFEKRKKKKNNKLKIAHYRKIIVTPFFFFLDLSHFILPTYLYPSPFINRQYFLIICPLKDAVVVLLCLPFSKSIPM